MKRLLFLIIGTLMLCCTHATGYYIVDGLRYLVRTDNNTAILCPLTDKKYSGDIIIPKEINVNGINYPVKSLYHKCFDECSSLTSVTIPEGVTSLGKSCFSGCSSLTSVTIPQGVTSLEDDCFYGCNSLTSVTIPEGVTSLGDNCFSNCSSLTSVTIPEGVTSLGGYCFYNCSNLTSVTLPKRMNSLGECCFEKCSSLNSITVPEGVTSLEYFSFYGCSSLTSVTIPEGVTSLEDDCFYGCNSLTSVTIPEGVTSLGDDCFYGCNSLTSVTIPEGVTSLGDDCFSNCSSLTSVTILGNTTYGHDCFSDCIKLKNIMIKSSTTSLSYTTNTYYGCVFYRCDSLMFISVPSSVKYISDFFPKRNKLLEKFYCYAINPPTLKDNITGPYSILFVPEQSIDLYKKASNWENFPFILPIESEATYVSQEKLYRDVKTSSKDGTVTLRGLKNGETVTFYNLNGKKIGQTVAKNGKASTKAGNEAIVIAKFGSSTIKIAVK